MTTTLGAFARAFANGVEFTGDASSHKYGHTFTSNKLQIQNIGVNQVAPGIFAPTFSSKGYVKHSPGAQTAHNLLYPMGIPGVNDPTYNIMVACGQNASPVQGDACILYTGTRMKYTRDDKVQDEVGFDVEFQPRGLRNAFGAPLQYINDTFKTATSVASTPFDDGAEGNGTLLGGVGMLQVYTPTGVAATGSITVPTQPVANDTVVVNGTTYTWKAALTPTANELLIGATATASAINLWSALTGSRNQYGVGYAAGSTSFNQTLASATVFFAPPTGASNTINITYATTGTAGNSFTLVKTGTGGLTISGAVLAGGVAGDTYNVVIASATSSGGSYTTLVTFSGIGATRAAYRTEVAVGTTINEWIKVTTTLATGAGTSQTCGIAVAFGRFFQA